MSDAMPSRLCKAAPVAFVLGVSSLCPFLSLAAALPALFLGVWAIRAINRSDGRLHGLRWAIAGLVPSVLVAAVSLLGLVARVLLSVQEKSHDASCKNNLRQIGLAINRYSDLHDHYFPPGTVPNAALKPERRLSWEAAILPFLSEETPAGKKWEELAGQIAFQEAWDAPANAGLRRNVAPFLCPTFAHALSPDQVGLTCYVGIAGVGDDAATLPRGHANAGFFGYDRLLRASDISARLDATMTAIETGQDNGPWPAGGRPTVRGVPPEGGRYIGKGALFGGLHHEGANVLWADGSVRMVTEKIDLELFRNEARIAR